MPPSERLQSAAVQAVVRCALQRRYLSSEQLREALLIQERMREQGQPTDLLSILRARFLSAEHLPELTQVYRQVAARPATDSRPTGSHPAFPKEQSIPEQVLVESGERLRRPPAEDPPAVRAFLAASGEGADDDESGIQHSLTSGRQRRVSEHPERIGGYRIVRELARGAFGIVYHAHSLKLDRPVALKLLRDADLASDEDHERFQIEARAAARLRHPGVVGIHDVGRDGDRPYLVMDLIEGESLRARLQREETLSDGEAARIAQALSEALYYAHSHHILHRDIKPDNILIGTDGRPLLTDFGLAKDARAARKGLTATGQAMGTPAYMPPEQAAGELDRVDRRSDVYSLGATLYEMISGRAPFDGPTALMIMDAVRTQEPELPRSFVPDVDRDLETICMKCLRKDPEARYGSMQELAEDLRRFLEDEPILARPPSALERAARWVRRNSVVAGATTVVASVVLVVGVGAYFWKAGIEQERAAQEERRRQDLRDEVSALIDQVEQGDQVGNDELRRVYYELLRHDEPAAVEVMLARLDAVSAELQAVRVGTYAEAAELTAEERAAGLEEIAGLQVALAALRAQRPGEELSDSAVSALKAAGKIVEQREYSRFRAALPVRRARAEQLIASRQGSLGERLTTARVLCHALGRVEHEGVLDCLGRYLLAESDPSRAIPAGLALSQHGGKRAQQLLLWARDRYGKKSEFWRSVKHGLKAIDEDVELAFESPTGHLYRAEAYLEKGDYHSCAASATKAIELDPESARAWAARARARWKLKDYHGALEDSRVVVRIDPRQPLGWIVQGAVHEEQGNLEAAMDAFSQGITHNPEEAWGWRSRAGLRTKLRLFKEALTDASRAIELGPDEARNWGCRGKVYHSLAKWEEAERDFARAVDLDRSSYVNWLNLSTARWRLQRFEEAESDATRALDLAAGTPKDVADVLTNRAVFHQSRGNFEAALRDLDAAIEQDPKAPRAWATRGGIRGMLGRRKEALADLDHALRLDDTLGEAWLNRGLMRAQLGDDAGALEDLGKAIQLSPEEGHAYSQRAAIRSAMGDLQGAAQDFDAAVRLNPRDPNTWYMIGLFYRRHGDLERAVESYTRGLSFKPDHLQLLAKRGDAHYLRGANEQALADYSKAIELDPQSAEILNKRGKANAELGELPAALDDYDRSLKLDPRNPITWLSRGTVRFQLGRKEEASEDLKRATDLAPQDPAIWKDSALILASWKAFDRALKHIGRALALGAGKDPGLWLYRAAIREMAGEREGAIEDFNKFLELRPDNPGNDEIRKKVRELGGKPAN